jgi:hypothetical protein
LKRESLEKSRAQAERKALRAGRASREEIMTNLQIGETNPHETNPQDFISKDIPAGHDTLWGWAAKWSPQDLPARLDPAKAFVIETVELLKKSRDEGYSVVDVEAPMALRALGATKVPAFDTQLLFMMSRS